MMWWFSRPKFFDYQVEGRGLVLKLAYFRGEVWLTQKQIAQILNLRLPTINEHLKKIIGNDGSLERVREFPIRAEDGKKYQVKHYRFDVVEQIQDKAKPLSSF